MIISTGLKKNYRSPVFIPEINFQLTGNRREFLQTDKGHIWKTTANITLNIKDRMLPLEDERNKIRMLALATDIWHRTSGSSKCNQVRKGKNVLQIVKEELKLSLFTDNVIVYVKHLMEFTDNLVELKKWDEQVFRILYTKINSVSID